MVQAWTAGLDDLNTARNIIGGVGIQHHALSFGGYTTTFV